WPECLILIACAVVLSLGISEKKGYHQDELLSFELSNAEFNPWIVPTQPQGRLAKFVKQEIRGDGSGQVAGNVWKTIEDVLKNRGNSKLLTYQADVYPEPVWIDRETFVEYVTVDHEDDFNYLSVYFNVKDDNHPPLHFMLLHTMSSLFQGSISPVMGCFINLCFVLGTMILLMKLARDCMTLMGCGDQGRITGVGAAVLYGLSAGALSTTLLIRMYAMLTFFCVLLLYVHLRKLFADKLSTKESVLPGFEKKNFSLIMITVLGFLTQYFFLFYCFALAFITAWILFREKRRKELGKYILSMIIAAVIGLVCFPFAISDVLSSGRGVEALEQLRGGLGDFAMRISAFLETLGKAGGMLCIFILLMICFGWGILSLRKEKQEKGIWVVLIFPVIVYFLLAAKLSPFLVDRYVMPIFPLVMLIITVGASSCLTLLFRKKMKKINLLLACVLSALALCQPFMPGHKDNTYLYPEYEIQEETATEYASLPCICVYEGVRYYENLIEFTKYEKTLLVTMEELRDRTDRASVEELDQVAVLLKKKEWTQNVNDIMAEYGFSPSKTVFTSAKESGDAVVIYSK
ncbi:MAG: hypothetical protein J6Z22_02750, partial [Lachnospiraceae bacterium]|nr:hypothetical protein [Lachnospiraceae bacterium]